MLPTTWTALLLLVVADVAHRAWYAGRPFGGGQFAVGWAGIVAGLAFPVLFGHLLGGHYAPRGERAAWTWPRMRLSPCGTTGCCRDRGGSPCANAPLTPST